MQFNAFFDDELLEVDIYVERRVFGKLLKSTEVELVEIHHEHIL